jgi:hypothetical protein
MDFLIALGGESDGAFFTGHVDISISYRSGGISPVRGFEGVAIGASPGQLFPKRDGLLHVPGNFAAYVLGRAIQRRHLGGVCIMRGLCIH